VLLSISPCCSFLLTDAVTNSLFLRTLVSWCCRSLLLLLFWLLSCSSHSFNPRRSSPLTWSAAAAAAAPSFRLHKKRCPVSPSLTLRSALAFLFQQTIRLPRWLPRSSPGPRPAIPSADPRYCTSSTWLLFEHCHRPRWKIGCCRQSAQTLAVATRHGHRRARLWLHLLSSSRASMLRFSCRRCRPWLQ
jgi:hypothetical protein